MSVPALELLLVILYEIGINISLEFIHCRDLKK